ncbi:MAG: NADH-quinone oxidoreductase subunit K [Rhodopila sp.]
MLPPIGIVVAVYTLWVGATEPGGAFQGGAILAAMWILVMLAGLRDAPPIGSRWLRLSVAAGPAAFVAVGLAGFALPTGLPRELRETTDHRRRGRADAVDRADSRPAGYRTRGAAAMTPATLYGLCSAVLVGAGLYGALVNPQPLRKILSLNLLGSGTFLLFGVIARRGAAAGLGGDPVPQAMVITGIVVAFSAIALLLRVFQETGRQTLEQPAPKDAGGG